MSKYQEPSTARVLAGAFGFFVPGLGHLLLNKIRLAAKHFIIAIIAWFIGLEIIFGSMDVVGSLDYKGVFMGCLLLLVPHCISAYFASNGDFDLNSEKPEVADKA